MRIERHYTTAGQSPFASVPMRKATSEIKNPDGSIVFKLEDILVPEQFSPGRQRYHCTKVFSQGRCPSQVEEGRRKFSPVFPVAIDGR